MAVVIASSTSSQAELEHAVSENWRTPPTAEELVPPAPTETEEEIPEVEEEGKTAAVTEPAEKTEDKATGRKGRYQRKIDRLVSQTTDLTSQLTEARRKIEELSARKETVQPEPKPASEPKQDDFKTVDEYVKSRVAWELDQRELKDIQAAQEESRSEIVKEYDKGLVEARAEFEDFDTQVGKDIPIHQGVVEAIRMMGKEGAFVTYHLATHPELCEELFDMPVAAAMSRIGVIAYELSKKKPASPEPKPRAVPPPPVRGVAGGSARPSELQDDLPVGEWIRRRESQVLARSGRRR